MKNIISNLFLIAVAFGLYQSCLPLSRAAEVTLTLSWSDNSDNEEGFLIFYKAPYATDFVSLEVDVPANVSTYQVTVNVLGGETFTYKVAAFNRWLDNYQVSGFSNEASWTAPVKPAIPNAPSTATLVLTSVQ